MKSELKQLITYLELIESNIEALEKCIKIMQEYRVEALSRTSVKLDKIMRENWR